MGFGKAIWSGFLHFGVVFPFTSLLVAAMPVAIPVAFLCGRRQGRSFGEMQPLRFLDRVLGSRRYRVNDVSVPRVLHSGDIHDPPLAPLLMYSDMTPLQFLAIFGFGAGYRLEKGADRWQVRWDAGIPGHGLPLRLIVLVSAMFLPAGLLLPLLLQVLVAR